MDDVGKTVFLSYRLEISWPPANAVRGGLHGFDVFLDTHDLDSGDVECAVSVPHDYVAEAMQNLRERFLRIREPLPAGAPPPMVGLSQGPALAEPTR